jgi:hypothetical protein
VWRCGVCSATSGMVPQCELLLIMQKIFRAKKQVDYDLDQLQAYQLLKINFALGN